MITINGKELQKPKNNINIVELISYVSENHLSDSDIITQIEFDKKHINDNEYRSFTVSDFNEIGFSTKRKDDFYLDTLNSLSALINGLTLKVNLITSEVDSKKLNKNFVDLVSGLEVFIETLFYFKTLYSLHSNLQLNVLEKDLISILNDISENTYINDFNYLNELIGTHLSKNFSQWVEEVIPELKKLK